MTIWELTFFLQVWLVTDVNFNFNDWWRHSWLYPLSTNKYCQWFSCQWSVHPFSLMSFEHTPKLLTQKKNMFILRWRHILFLTARCLTCMSCFGDYHIRPSQQHLKHADVYIEKADGNIFLYFTSVKIFWTDLGTAVLILWVPGVYHTDIKSN